jgi:hypothetical protein
MRLQSHTITQGRNRTQARAKLPGWVELPVDE